jgi:hypothetical protein
MPNLRLIRIVPLGNGAAFEPNPSGVQGGDTIHWNNETNEDHWLETTTGGFLTNNIPGGEVSNPGVIANSTIEYRCKLHPQELGSIEIVPAVMVPAVLVPAAAVSATLSAPAATAAVGGGISSAPKRKAKKPVRRRKAAKKKGRAKKKGG